MHLLDILYLSFTWLPCWESEFIFYEKNEGTEDYYIGGRSIGSWHVAFSGGNGCGAAFQWGWEYQLLPLFIFLSTFLGKRKTKFA